MAETDREQKTEEPTAKRLLKAREDGQVARSPDFTFALLLLAGALMAWLAGGAVKDGFERALHLCLGGLAPAATGDDAPRFALAVLERSLLVLLPFLLAFLPVAAAAGLVQVGYHFVPAKLRLRTERLMPNLAPSRFVNGKSLIETLTSVLKLIFLLAAFHLAVWSDVQVLLATESLAAVAGAATRLITRLLVFLGVTMLAIGLLDLALKRRDTKKDLRMTKEEVKQEAKDAQGDPEVRVRIKRRQRELALRRMMEAVPKASVVITNPTHFAVAIKYDGLAGAPTVVAKGLDFLALKIRELAERAKVPIVENPPLARALHDTVEVGQEIPPHLYQAVAEVLAAILKTRDRIGRTA